MMVMLCEAPSLRLGACTAQARWKVTVAAGVALVCDAHFAPIMRQEKTALVDLLDD